MEAHVDLGLLVTFLAACGAAAATGSFFPPGSWYLGLTKPTWTPKGWVFPVVWTTLYVLMAVAAARVAGLALPGAGLALGLWSVQIALNALWTPVYFGAHRMRAGSVIIGLLWLAVAATMLAFFRIDLIAGLLLVPYLVWVTIATALCWTVLRLNPAEAR
jgi:tryptophan-rich sensory protein